MREPLDRLRRSTERIADQAAARTVRWLRGGGLSVPFDGHARFALLTVNYSTTRYLKLMLRTLVQQQQLERLQNIIICDNHSRDGGLPFLRHLAARCPRITLIENHWWTQHARGIRLNIRALDRRDAQLAAAERANVLLAVDTDLIWRRVDALAALARVFESEDAAFAGELRRHIYPLPEAQASFLAVRRDWAARRDIPPWVNHGSPAWPLQQAIWKAGGKGVDFRSNQMGYALHRGRAGVAAARDFVPGSSHATARVAEPHFMGVTDGERIWQETEARYAEWLEPAAEDRLIELLVQRLA